MRRRTFLLTGLGAGGALVLGWSLTPPRPRLHPHDTPLLGDGHIALNGWLAIAPDDTVAIIAPRSEMGQGIHTALAMIIAEELDCSWDAIRVVHAPIDRIYNNIAGIVDGLPIHPDAETHPIARAVRWFTAKTAREFGLMMTGGSSSVRDCWEVARDAGAIARTQLLESAAETWGVDSSTCTTANGLVRSGERSLRYGELVVRAAARTPGAVKRKTPDQFTRIGQRTPPRETADITSGAIRFGIDVQLPDMLYAAVAMPPTLGSVPTRYNTSAAMQQRGVRAVVPLTGSPFGDSPGIAIIADSWWRAQQALSALAIVWSESPHTALTSSGILETLRMVSQEREGFPFRSTGDAEAVLDAASTTPESGTNRLHEAVYDAPYLAHATMEPLNATVQVDGTTAQVWTGTQMPDVARRAAANVLGLSESAVTLHQYRLGGGFGRRLEVDYVAQAARIAAALPGTPVCTIWSRADDLRHDMYRPACAAHLRAAIDGAGSLKALSVHSASQAPFQSLSRRIGFAFTKHGPDRTTAEGAWDQPYEIPSLRVAHAALDFPVPVGLWRSVGHSHQAFFLESFIDELAYGAGLDPLAYRLALLKQHARAAAVLRLAAERADWGTPAPITPDGQPCARGLALHASFGTIVAQVATVSVSPSRGIRVHRVVSAIDCGLPVNPSGIEQQVEGAIVVGLSAALFGEVTIANGRVQPANFHEYRLLRHNECPVMETHIIARGDMPSGVGEPGLPPIAPAVANALFALTGTRLRSLPLRLPPTP